uniref:Transmembrane 9 superfamily member n=1 Tax=Cyprinus carpio carpio TaxID=630221 RepID=A0A8C1CMY0_CYPCA
MTALFLLQYTDKEEVVLWMNTVGPYHNRQETYKYFSLPFCVGTKKTISHYHETLGEALQGVELEFSGLDITFKEEVMQTTYCDIELDKPKRDAFVYAIKNHYWYQMYIDDLPIWGIVGEADENGEDHYLWTYKKLEIGYNGNRIVDVNLTSEGKVKLVPNTRIPMSYSVKWKKSDVKFEDRFDKYLDPSFFQHRIHWFSIFNSFMMVIFLVGLVSMILMRTLRKDYARYSKEEEMDDMDRDLGDEYGWKQVHGDVFRPSSHPLIFSSLVGSGCQIFSVSLIVIILAMIEDLYTERGSMLSTAIFVYAATSPVNGYFGGSLYAKQGGRRWINILHQLHRYLLPCLQSHPIRHHGEFLICLKPETHCTIFSCPRQKTGIVKQSWRFMSSRLLIGGPMSYSERGSKMAVVTVLRPKIAYDIQHVHGTGCLQ